MDKSVWKLFSKYHYLDANHNNNATVYVAYINDNIAGFISVAAFPGLVHNRWKVHRLVVLPDYQGIGLGVKMLNDVAEIYKQIGKQMRIITSAPSLIYSLKNNKNWNCSNFGKGDKLGGYKSLLSKSGSKKISSTQSRYTATFYYK